MACRNCTSTCTCLIVTGDSSQVTISGDGSTSNPYTLNPVATRQTDTYTYPGTLAAGTGTVRRYFPHNATITRVSVGVGTAPTGQSIKVDVNRNGTTIFTTQGNRPEIAAAGFSDTSSIPDVTAITAGQYITIDIDQVGSGVAGADLVVTIEYYR